MDTGEHKDGGLPPHSPKRHHRTADNLKKLFHSVQLSATFPSGVLFKNRFVLTRAPTCEAAATSLRGRCKQNSPLNNHSYMTWSPTLPAAQISRSAQSMQHSFMSVGDTSRWQDFIVGRWCRGQKHHWWFSLLSTSRATRPHESGCGSNVTKRISFRWLYMLCTSQLLHRCCSSWLRLCTSC